MLWKATKKIGFGVALGKMRSGADKYNCVYVVANYKEQGNYLNKFEENVLRPEKKKTRKKPRIKNPKKIVKML